MKQPGKGRRVTVRFPAELQTRLERRAKLAGKTESDVVREAVEAHVAEPVVSESACQLAKRLGLVGCVKDAPADLSTNKKHFEGFGASR